MLQAVVGFALVCPAGWCAFAGAAEDEAAALAAEVRWQAPVENFTTTGTLRLRDRSGRWWKELSIQMDVIVSGHTWRNHYSTLDAARQPVETLIVTHYPGGTNRYQYLPPGPEARPLTLAGKDALIPFAGSHFWLADFGLEFLFWPEQRIVGPEMRKGRACKVLESVNPAPKPGQYAFVRSWIDLEKKGLLRAEAYDENHKLLKEFNIGGFKKVDGRWQLKSMEIRDELTDERSRLEFDLEIE